MSEMESLTSEDTFTTLLAAERRVESETGKNIVEGALTAHGRFENKRTCYAYGEKGHIARDCPKKSLRSNGSAAGRFAGAL